MSKFLKSFYLLAIYFFLYLPVVVLVLYSFNNARFLSTWSGGTLKWYVALIHDMELLKITRNSLVVAGLASTLAVLIGTIGSVALYRYRFFGKQLMNGLIFALIVVPDLVFGISLLMLYSFLKIPLGFLTLLVAHVTFCLPFVVVVILSALQGSSRQVFEAARDLGASDRVIFVKVIWPIIMSAVVAGWLLSFTLSLDDVIISFFVTGPTFQILPLYIFSRVHLGVTPEVNALCSVMLLFTVIMVLISRVFLNKGIDE